MLKIKGAVMKDKKIGRFRKWLIEKLGGKVDEPMSQPIIIKNVRHAKTFESNLILKDEEFKYWVDKFPQYYERELKRELWQKLGEQTIPYLTIIQNKVIERGTVEYKARLTIVKEYEDER